MATTLGTIIERIQQRAENQTSYFGAVLTGVFAGAMMVIMTVTYAALIFSGDLNQFVGKGIALGLTSVIIIGIVFTIFGSSAHLVTQIDDDTAPVFALLLSILVASLPATLSDAELLSNILAALFVATFITGFTLAVFGLFKFGNFVQFLPYSVMGGYFAAVGWLLLLGAITMLTGIEMSSLLDIGALFTLDELPRWIPAVLIGIFLSLMSGKVSMGVLIGGTTVIATGLFFGVYHFLGSSPAELMASNHLIGPFNVEKQQLLHPVTSLDWNLVSWDTTLGTAGSIASIALISLLSIILCVSGLSLTTRRDLDINHELKVAGFANMSSGFLGGMSALPSLSISKLAYEIYPIASRIIGVTAILVGIITFYFGMTVVAHIPKIVLGGLSIYIGLGFVREWLIDGYKKFGALEYSVIPIILVVSIIAGFLQGVVTGIIAAIILFVIKYSRIKIIRYQASGSDLRSNIVRDAEQNAILKDYGRQIRLFTLQGYLFFGTAGSLYRTVLDAIDAPQNHALKYIILDFSQVIGVDSSATLNFEKLAQRLTERKIFLITTSLKSDVLEILRRGGFDLSGNSYLIQHIDLDQGMEWCENDILKQQDTAARERRGIHERIADLMPHSDQLNKLDKYLRRLDVEAGQLLMNIGENSEEVFFLETCAASAYIIDARNKERRVSGAGRGAIYGEIGFFIGIPRTAIVRADTKGALYSLSRKSLAQMEREEPELAAAIIRHLAQIVTERLVNTTQSLRAVL